MFDLDPLTHAVDVTGSSHRVNAAKIEIKLKKQQPGIKWTKIEGEEGEVVATMGEWRGLGTRGRRLRSSGRGGVELGDS